MKKWLKRLLLAFLALIAVMLVKMLLNRPPEKGNISPVSIDDDTAALKHLAEAVRFRTVSYDDSQLNRNLRTPAMLALQAWMKQTYPLLRQKARWESLDGGSLLITIDGSTNEAPALFLAHLDVVPAPDSAKWKHAPFAGTIHGDTLTGRGTLDDKNVAVAMLEAMEKMLRKGQKPQRTIMFAFGHDEETGGMEGAAQIAALLKQQGIRAAFIADEGFGVMNGVVPGLDRPCAIIGLAEKGNVSLKLTVKAEGSHSAWPSDKHATLILSKALARLDEEQFEARLDDPMRGLFEKTGPYMSPGYKFLISNLWLTSPLLKKALLSGPKTAAAVRTTHATTMMNAGDKDNVVPTEAWAVVNFRLLPGDRIADVEKQVREWIADDRVQISRYLDHHEASPVSPSSGIGYDEIETSIGRIFPDAVVAPGMVVTGTDCKNYTEISDRIYRFVPFVLSDHNLSGIHGRDEYVTLRQMSSAVAYYTDLFARI